MFHRIPTLVMFLLLIGLLPAAVSAQGGGSRAALVVRAGDGSVRTKCVSFSESAISGEELLNRSGMTVVINPNLGQGVRCAASTAMVVRTHPRTVSASARASSASIGPTTIGSAEHGSIRR